MLKVNSFLRTLKLNNNNITTDAAWKFLDVINQTWVKIETIDLQKNPMDEKIRIEIQRVLGLLHNKSKLKERI